MILACKVIPGECVVSQHELLVADFRFQMRARRSKQAKIARTKWWKLKGEMAEVFKGRVIVEELLWRALGMKRATQTTCGRRWRPAFGR